MVLLPAVRKIDASAVRILGARAVRKMTAPAPRRLGGRAVRRLGLLLLGMEWVVEL